MSVDCVQSFRAVSVRFASDGVGSTTLTTPPIIAQ
jgi:hypothetical protein